MPVTVTCDGFLHWFTDAKHIEMISEKLYHFFWHLIGPHIHPLQLLFNAGTMLKKHFVNCETRTSTCRSFATISSGLYRFLAITVL